MGQVRLLSIISNSDESDVGLRVFNILRYAINRKFTIDVRFDEQLGDVVADIPGDCNGFVSEVAAYCQNLLIGVSGGIGWKTRILRLHGKRAIPIQILGYTYFSLRQVVSSSVTGARVGIRGASGLTEYEIWVGGPFRSKPENGRAFGYGQVIGLGRQSGTSIFTEFRDFVSGARVFQVSSLAWIEKWQGRTVFVVLERIRGGRRCWRLIETHEIDQPLF